MVPVKVGSNKEKKNMLLFNQLKEQKDVAEDINV